MSRTRIVKGKITEIIGGDLRYYSEADIIESAAAGYAEKSGTRILHAGNPGSSPQSPTLAKCAVFFRPQQNWKGEFGFDWPRVGDSKLETDVAYNSIIGKYGKVYATDFSNPKDLPKFTLDINKYKSILSEYDSFSVFSGIYYTPNMTLNLNETAILNAIVHVSEKADKLHYAYNKEVFEITVLKQFTVAKGVNYDEGALQIKCKQKFSSPETIRVIATKNELMQKVGAIKISPNNCVKNVNILMIPVKVVKMNSEGEIKGSEKDLTINAMRQAYLTANIIEKASPIIADGFWFNFFFLTKDKDGKTVTDTSNWVSLHKELDSIFFKEKENNRYKDYYRVYMLPTSLNLNGIAEAIGNVKTVVAFNNRNESSTAHELLHAMGLHHTFDNNSKYTFKLQNTDNIMDYTHQVRISPTSKIFKKRYSTNKFQWQKINPDIK